MRPRLLWPLLSTAFFCFACAGACGPRGTWVDLEHDGLDRGYVLYSPPSWEAGEALPVVLALHGGGGNASGTQRFTGFNELADVEGFHVVYPEGVDKGWNDGRTTVPGRDTSVDDLGFLDAVLDDVDARVGLGPVMMTGVSNGGFMTWGVVCSGSDRIAAIAPTIAGRSTDSAPSCAPAGPIPTLIIQGTEDPLVPYEGGPVEVLGVERGEVVATEETLAFIRDSNGCDLEAEPSVRTVDEDPDDGTSLVITRWSEGCAAPVEELRVEGGGHTWPGGTQYLPKGMVGTVTREIKGEQAVWDFFEDAVDL